MVKPQKFKTKPVEIEALQRTGQDNRDVSLVQWLTENNARYRYECVELVGIHQVCSGGGSEAHDLIIQTLEGPMKCPVGWWIIRGLKGEFYPCDPEVFALKYEEITDA